MWIGGEAAAYADGIADFVTAFDCRQGDVVDLWIGAPDGAAGDGDLELARQIVELGVAVDLARDGLGQRRGVDQLVAVEAGQGQPVTLRATSPQAPLGESPAEDPERFNNAAGRDSISEPMQLDGLAGRDVGQIAGVILGQRADGAHLLRSQCRWECRCAS
jgi:hypothetical protein